MEDSQGSAPPHATKALKRGYSSVDEGVGKSNRGTSTHPLARTADSFARKAENAFQTANRFDAATGPAASFCLSVFFLIPVAVMAVAFVFGSALAAVEGWDVYEGFLYVIGNLVGLGTPLTDVTVTDTCHGHGENETHTDEASCHNVFGELFDLVVALWSLSIAAAIIGLVGAMSFTTGLVQRVEGMVRQRSLRAAARLASRKLGDETLTLEGFQRAVARLMLPVAPAMVRRAFIEVDKDGNGQLEGGEVAQMIERLCAYQQRDAMQCQISELTDAVAAQSRAIEALQAQMKDAIVALQRLAPQAAAQGMASGQDVDGSGSRRSGSPSRHATCGDSELQSQPAVAREDARASCQASGQEWSIGRQASSFSEA